MEDQLLCYGDQMLIKTVLRIRCFMASRFLTLEYNTIDH